MRNRRRKESTLKELKLIAKTCAIDLKLPLSFEIRERQAPRYDLETSINFNVSAELAIAHDKIWNKARITTHIGNLQP